MSQYLPQERPQSVQETTAELRRAQEEWRDAVAQLTKAGRRLATVSNDPHANPLEAMRYLLYIISGDCHHAMEHLLNHFETYNHERLH